MDRELIMPNLIWEKGLDFDNEPTGNEPHTHSLINLASYEAREAAHKNHDHESGEPRPDKPTESGLGLVQQGHAYVLMHLAVVLTNKPESLALVRGQHDSAISYKTLTEVKALVKKWNPEREGV